MNVCVVMCFPFPRSLIGKLLNHVPPASRRRTAAPTPQQGSQQLVESLQRQAEEEDEERGEHERRWTAKEKAVVPRLEQYLKRTNNIKVEIEELEHLFGPEDPEVDLRRIVMEARKFNCQRFFVYFFAEGPRELLVASKAHWERYQRDLVAQEEVLKEGRQRCPDGLIGAKH